MPAEGKLVDIEKAQQKKDLTARLRRLEGQIRGIQRMLDEDRPCEEIITQMMAARAALDKVGISIVTEHVQECARMQTGEAEEADRKALERALALFLRLQ
jgi:DNA-binding FrmR family transcriptional regulator